LTKLDGGCAFRPRCRYVIDRCATEIPELEETSDGQLTACWHGGKLDDPLQEAS